MRQWAKKVVSWWFWKDVTINPGLSLHLQHNNYNATNQERERAPKVSWPNSKLRWLLLTVITESERILESEREKDRETKSEGQTETDIEDKSEESLIHPSIHPHKGKAKAARGSRERHRRKQVWGRERNRGRQTPFLQVWQYTEELRSKKCKRNKQVSGSPGLRFSAEPAALPALWNTPPIHASLPVPLTGMNNPPLFCFPGYGANERGQ